MNDSLKNIFYSAIVIGTFLIIRKPINKTINNIVSIYRAFKPCNYKYESDSD